LSRNYAARFLIALLTVLPLSTVTALAGTGDRDCFRRGVAIHNMMNWGAVQATQSEKYEIAPFRGPTYETPDALLRNVAAAGFDFIRLTIDPGPFLQLTGESRDALDRHLLAVIKRLSGYGFCVMVDFHPNEQVAAYAPVRLTRAIDDPVFAAYAQMIKRTAGILAALRSDRIALELMNEPQYGWDAPTTERWQRMLEQLYAAARTVAPNMLIVVTGARGGDDKGLMAVDPAPFDKNTLYSFHYYQPYEFTHQGVKSTQPSARSWQFISGLPYPAQSGDPERVWQGIERNIISSKGLDGAEKQQTLREVRASVARYIDAGFGRAQIAAHFAAISDWAKQHGIAPTSILLGEFGVTRTYGFYRASDPASQGAWLRDVRQEAESRGFRWAFWALTGYGGMALVASDGSTSLDAVSVRALGLSAGF